MWITKVSINQPVFAIMVMAALLVLGVFSYQRLPVEQMPDVTDPSLHITVEYPGASPEAMETDLVKPIENVVNTVSGVHRIYSTMREGTASVDVEFSLDTNINVAVLEVRDKISEIRSTFPRDVKDPQILRSGNDNTQPVGDLDVYSDTRDIREVSNFAEQVVIKRLQEVPGVGNIVTSGEAVRQIQIYLKPDMLQSYRIGVNQVLTAIQNANQDLPAGSIIRGADERLVRVEGRIKDPAAFGRIIVGTQGSAVYLQQAGIPVYLSQVADVVDGQAEATSITRVNGKRAVGLAVYKVQDANVVKVGEGIKAAIEELRKRLPPDIQLAVLDSNSDFIEASLHRVKETILEGGCLTILIVFLFLHSWRSTIITGLTLPISVIATFIALHAFGFTLNFISLMALSLCIGLLIDDAIVVRENIVRHLHMGKSHIQAAREGTEEIGLAVTATTFAILAVFVPVAFMSGFIGRFFFQFGITVAVAVLLSLFVSFTLDPMLSSLWPDPEEGRFRYMPWLGRMMDRIEAGVERVHVIYGKLLAWALSERRRRLWFPLFGLVHAARSWNWRQIGTISNRGIVLWGAAFAFFGSFLLVPMIGTEFIPQDDEAFISLQLNTPIGSSLDYTDTKMRQVEEALREFPEIEVAETNIGTDSGNNYARINLKLTNPETTHRRSQKELEAALRQRLSRIAGLQVTVGGYNWAVFVSIIGPDESKLVEISQDLMRRIAKVPGIADLQSSERGANPTVSVHVNSVLANDLGLNNALIGNALRPLIAGNQVSHWLGPDGQDYDVIVRLPKSDRQVSADLGDLYLSGNRLNPDGTPMLVPLRQVAEFVDSTTPEQLKRLNLECRVLFYANASGRPAGDVGSDVEKIMKDIKLPPGYRFDSAGQQEGMNESFSAALAAMGLAVIFIYLILASQFGSFLQPVAIMMSLPLSLAGVFAALLLTHTTLNLFSIIGFIMLMGLVTKNAILLVDFTNHGIREGKPLRQALLDAGQVRLRPILMTTLAMIFGMLPMAIGFGDGGELQAPMGRAVIGGIVTSTLLTLVVVPVIYTFLFEIGRRFKAWFTAPAHAHRAVQGGPDQDVLPVK